MKRKETNSTDQATIALKKAKTSIERILKMIESQEYCIDILQQILAVQGLLKSSSEKILKNHLYTCFAEGMSNSNKGKKIEMIDELVQVIKISEKAN